MTSRHEVDTQRKRQRDSSERDGKMQPPPNRAPAVPQGANRMHEYFVSKDGIDREVITADICRYLGNDALVRPGTYENPTTGQVQNGFFIKAYRNLTNAMIEDLKLDSARWENERRAAPTGRPVNAPSYLQSQTHESRQYYGHNEGPPQPQVFSSQGPPPDRYMSDAPYASMQPQSGSYVQPQPGFDPRPSGNFPIHNEPPRGGEGYYVSAGTHYDSRTHGGRLPASQVESIPRGEALYAHGGSGPYQPQDTRFSSGYPSQVPVSSAPPFAASQQDPYYNSRPPQQEYHQDTPMGGAYQESRPMYSEQTMYSNTGPSSSGPLNPSISSTANSSRSRDTHRSDDRRRDHRDHRDDRHRR